MAVNIKKKSKLGQAPKVEESTNNLEAPSPTENVNLVFTVPEEFRREYKMYAVSHGKSMVDILKASFEEYKEKYG